MGCCRNSRFQCHAAYGTRPRPVTHNLRMHWAGVLNSLRLQRHSARWTRSRFALLHLWIHGADPGCGGRRSRWNLRRLRNLRRMCWHSAYLNQRRLVEKFLWLSLEAFNAAWTAKVVGLSSVFSTAAGLLRINKHPADWVQHSICRWLGSTGHMFVRAH